MGRKEAIAAQYFNTVKAAVIADAVAVVQGPAAVGTPAPPDMRTLATQLQAKANASTVQQISQSVNTLSAAMNGKADTSEVNTLQASVVQHGNALNNKASTATVNALAATVTQQTTDIAGKVSKAGDTVTGLLVVPPATHKLAAPRFEQVFGGINSPRRTMENLTTGTMELAPLTDTTGQNRKILPIGVLFLLTGNLNLLSTVTVKLGTTSGGAELYTKTYSLLTGLLGKVLAPDLPASATPLPAGQRLYATVVGGGQWTVFFDAVFLPTAV